MGGALELCLGQLGSSDAVVGTTGFASREIYELRDAQGQSHQRDFLTVGSMGHASAIALGIATGQPSRNVFCFDGDGAMLMHLGNMATVGKSGCRNLKHVVMNNRAHDSVGAQPTGIECTDIPRLAKSLGYSWAQMATSKEELQAKFGELMKQDAGPALLEVIVRPGARKNLGRPKTSPKQNKDAFMTFMQS